MGVIHTTACKMTHSFVWLDSIIMCGMTHSSVWHDPFSEWHGWFRIKTDHTHHKVSVLIAMGQKEEEDRGRKGLLWQGIICECAWVRVLVHVYMYLYPKHWRTFYVFVCEFVGVFACASTSVHFGYICVYGWVYIWYTYCMFSFISNMYVMHCVVILW